METKPTGESQTTIESIPSVTQELIEQEVEKDVKDIGKTTREALKAEGQKDEGFINEVAEQTCTFHDELTQDQRESEYLLLRWHRETNDPQRIFYVGSGHDVIPKHVFGEERVVHLGMEDYFIDKETGERDKKYFPELGSGDKVVGDARFSPFKDNSFDTIFLQDMVPDNINRLVNETERLLKSGGRVILSKMMLTSDRFDDQLRSFEESEQYEQEPVPQDLQQRGLSESEFIIFKKK